MSTTIHYSNCPVCNSSDTKIILSLKDHSVSGENFLIAECTKCTLRFTQDIPDASSILPYYKSENYISHTNSSKGVINSLYQWVRKRTLRQKRKLVGVATGVTNGKILDIGAGTGAFVHEMKQHGWQVTGLEPDNSARNVGKEMFNVELGDISGFYQLEKNSYDAITMWHVLEHVHELQAYIAQLSSLLKENGRLFVAVPNYTSKDAAIYKEYWAAYDVPRHLYHFSPMAMKILMEKNGLKIKEYKPMWYDSFYVSMLSSKYKNGSTNFLASIWNGCRSNLSAMRDMKKCSSVIYIISK